MSDFRLFTREDARQLSAQICRAMGFDPANIRRLRLTLEVGELPAVEVEYYLPAEGIAGTVKAVSDCEFVLVQKRESSNALYL